MIDISSESVIPLTEAPKVIPGRPSITSLWRWSSKGVRGKRLETILIGGKRFTSREAIQRFADAPTDGTAEPTTSRTSKQRERDITHAERELAEQGI